MYEQSRRNDQLARVWIEEVQTMSRDMAEKYVTMRSATLEPADIERALAILQAACREGVKESTPTPSEDLLTQIERAAVGAFVSRIRELNAACSVAGTA